MAAGLVGMVARLSVGRKGMEAEAFYQNIFTEAEELGQELFKGAAEDAESFEAIRAGYRLPKGNDEERAVRRQAIQEATVKATMVPLRGARRCRRVLELCEQLKGRSNPNAVSDLECAGYLALAGAKGCLSNVAINIPSIEDEALAAQLNEEAQALVEGLS